MRVRKDKTCSTWPADAHVRAGKSSLFPAIRFTSESPVDTSRIRKYFCNEKVESLIFHNAEPGNFPRSPQAANLTVDPLCKHPDFL